MSSSSASLSGENEFCQPIVCPTTTDPLVESKQYYVDATCAIPEVTLQALAAFPTYWWHHYQPDDLDYDFIVSVMHRNGCSQNQTSSPV